ncbi:MAG: hypothetical protein AAF597_10925, partial [Bacteroidota bacterium]
GTWYLRTIYLVESDQPEITHESNWATLTFGVKDGGQHSHAHGDGHSHDHGDGHSHSHDGGEHHDHNHEESGLPGYAYWLISFAIVTGLFFWFNRNEAAE